MLAKEKFSVLILFVAVCAPCLSSCGLPAALWRSANRIVNISIDDESGVAREAMFESLREIHREGENGGVNPPAADSTR